MNKTIMKRSALVLLIFTFCHTVWAQIPNGGFEFWSSDGLTPSSWQTTNGLMILGNNQTIFKTTDAHQDSFACKIVTQKLTKRPPGNVFIPDYMGSMFIGNQIVLTSIYGFPYSSKPAKFEFWYKFNARNSDSARIGVITTRWNNVLNRRDTISNNLLFLTDSVGIYTKSQTVLTYLDTLNTCDTAIIFVSSANLTSTHIGATLYIDDLAFTGGNVGFNELKEQEKFLVYPNPVTTNQLTIETKSPQGIESITLSNVQGELVFAQKLHKEMNHQIDCSKLSRGLYMLIIHTSDASITRKISIE